MELRPDVKIKNPECLDSLSKRFQELEPACTESRCISLFPRSCPPVENLCYDKTSTTRSDIFRRLSQAFSKTFPIPVSVELGEESIFYKIQQQEGVAFDPNDNSLYDSIVDCTPKLGINLEKKKNVNVDSPSVAKEETKNEEPEETELPNDKESANRDILSPEEPQETQDAQEHLAKEAEKKRLEEECLEIERLEKEAQERAEVEKKEKEEINRKAKEEQTAKEAVLERKAAEQARGTEEDKVERLENEKLEKEIRSYIDSRLKNIETNLERFFDRSETAFKEAQEKLQSIQNKSASNIVALVQEKKPILQEWSDKLAVLKACNARRKDGSVLEYGLSYHLKNFVGSVRIYNYFPPLLLTPPYS